MKRVLTLLLSCILAVAVTATITVSAKPAAKFSVNKDKITIEEGETFTLKVDGKYAKTGKTKWKVADKSIVAIKEVTSRSKAYKNYKAKFKAKKPGTTTIRITNTKTKKVLKCKVVVQPKKITIGKPVITSAIATGTTKAGSIKVIWNKVENAAQYNIQISAKEDFSTTYRDFLTSNTCYNTGWNYYNNVGAGSKNPTYYCRVKAIAADGTESGWSEIVACEQNN